MDTKILFYEKLEDKIRCRVCPHNCLIDEGEFGVCKLRTVKND